MNSWSYLSSELLTFYIESIRGFKSVTISTYQLFPTVLYSLAVVAILLSQIGLILAF